VDIAGASIGSNQLHGNLARYSGKDHRDIGLRPRIAPTLTRSHASPPASQPLSSPFVAPHHDASSETADARDSRRQSKHACRFLSPAVLLRFSALTIDRRARRWRVSGPLLRGLRDRWECLHAHCIRRWAPAHHVPFHVPRR
jgi:hypothetical protein